MEKRDRYIEWLYNNNRTIKGVFITFGVVILFLFCAWTYREIQADSAKFEQARIEHEIASNTVGEVITTNILGLKVDETISGKAVNVFYFGYGKLSSTDYYVVYAVQDDGGLLLTKYPCEDTVVYPILTEDEQPYYEETYSQLGKIISKKLYVPISSMQMDYKLD